MKTKAKRYPFSRVVCVLLTVLTVFGAMSSLFLTEPQKVKAASDWYTIVTASSDRYGSEVHYYGYDYENKKMVTSGDGLSFAFTSGYEIQYGDQLYHASCAQMGYQQPTNAVTFKGLLEITAGGTHTDNNNNRVRYGAHYTGEGNGEGRSIPYNFIFKCWYYCNKQYGKPSTGAPADMNWSSGFLQEAVSIAYRYEWDTRLIQKVTGRLVNGKWETNTNPNTWTDNPNFIRILTESASYSAASLPNVANVILEMAIKDEDHIESKITNINPKTGERDNYGIYYKASNGDIHVLRLLDTPAQKDGASLNYQDLFLYAVNETPPPVKEFYNINLYKKDADSNENLSGATFALYKKSGSTWSLYSADPYKTTDSSGYAGWELLEEGDYYVKETTAPSGYELNNAQIDISFPDGTNKSVSRSYTLTYSGNDANVTVYESKSKGTLKIKKVDIKDKPISGVTFGLYSRTGRNGYIRSATTDSSGEATFTDLAPGTYYLHELSAPSGYKFDINKEYTGTVYSDTTTWANGGEAVENPPESYSIQLVKYRAGSGFIYLSGATFALYKQNNNGSYTLYSTKVTDSDGKIDWTGLEDGNYYYVETIAPRGYELDTTKHYVSFPADGNGKGFYSKWIEEYPETYWTPQVEKKLTRSFDTAGEPESNFGEFSFVLKEWNGSSWVNVEQKSIIGSGTVTFNEITYGWSDYGDHRYRVYEENGDNERVSYDDHYVEFTVTVTRHNSTASYDWDRLEISTSVSSNQHPASASDKEKTTFTNYVPDGTWTPTAQKVLIGRKLTDKEFTFTLEENVSGTWKTLQTKQNTADGTVPFEEIYYTLANVGTHTYRVSEVKGTDSTVIYDEHTVTYTVTVSYDRKNGTALTITESTSSPMSIKYSYTGSGLHATSISAETTYEDYSIPAIQLTRTITYSDTNQVVTDTITVPAHRTNTMIRPASLVVFALQAKNYVFNEDPVLDAKNFQWTWYSNSTNKYQSASEYLADNPSIAYFTCYPTDTTIRASSSITRNGMIGTLAVFTNYVPVEIKVEKVDPNGKTLAGAEFLLQWSEDGKLWKNIAYTEEIEKGGCSNASVADGKLTTSNTGKIAYERLYPGLYYRLTETKASDGMQLLTETAYEGVLPPDTAVTNPDTVLELRVVNQPVFTLPATGGRGFWSVALAVPLFSVSIAILLGGGSFKKKKQK